MEAQALFALYEYGALHGGVRIRRRAGDRLLPVSWSMRGDADLHDIVSASVRHWLPVEIVIGASAGLPDPWLDATTVTIVERDRDVYFVRQLPRTAVTSQQIAPEMVAARSRASSTT